MRLKIKFKRLALFLYRFKKYFGDNLSSKRENKLFTGKILIFDDDSKITGKIDLINIG